jgi:hypothetical protein
MVNGSDGSLLSGKNDIIEPFIRYKHILTLFYELSYDRKMCGYLILDSNCMQDR